MGGRPGHRRRRRAAGIVVAALVAGVVAAACTERGGGARFLGRTFLSESVTQDGRPLPLVAGTSIRLTFHDDGRLTASAGCNSMGGPVRTDGGRIAVADLATTEMGCDPERHARGHVALRRSLEVGHRLVVVGVEQPTQPGGRGRCAG